MLRVLRLIGLPHSSSDSIFVHRKLLRKHIVKMRAERRPVWENARNGMRRAASETNASNEALAEVVRNWPQQVSHAQKAAIVHGFGSITSAQALKSFTCASCAERVCHNKRCDRGPPSTYPLSRSMNTNSLSGRVALTPCDPPSLPRVLVLGPSSGVGRDRQI